MKKKIFFLVLICFLFLFVRQAKADVYTTPLVDELKSPNLQLGSHTFATVTKITESLTTLIIGTNDEGVNHKLGASAVGTIGNLIAAMYTHPPASSVEYFADLGKNLGIVKPAYAQAGVGFQGLTPILPLWKAFRNVAYVFFTIVFIAVGLAIMFRVKLNPQTVISIQNAIPRIVVALILVTFSYAIAGLLIDLIYILTGLAISVLAAAGLPSQEAWEFLHSKTQPATVMSAFNLVMAGNPWGFLESLASALAIPAGIGILIGGIVGALAGASGGILGILGGGAAGAVGGALGVSALIILILSIILLWAMFKLFLTLLKSYVQIIIGIIFAPLQIMTGVLPGAQMGFGSWLRNLISNIFVFPAAAIFLLIGTILVSTANPLRWAPPLMGLAGNAMQLLIGFGILLMSPKVADMVKEALQVKPFPYGTAIGEPFRPARTLGKTGFYYGAETGIEVLERGAAAAGRTTGWDIAVARTARKILGLK